MTVVTNMHKTSFIS